ncbi:MAG: Uma2 family endonuclease [Elainellaceae cyanobacterium]
MVTSPQHPPDMTADEYLDWEPQQDIRYEFVHGQVTAMTGGTVPHNDIALNLYTALRPHLKSRGCRINVSDVKVQVSATSLYHYPDVVVSCDPQDLSARKFIQYPKLIVEVLSPGTEAKDRGEKFSYYQTLPSLQEYGLVQSERVSVECYRRGEGRMWLYYPYTKGDVIHLSSIDFECPIDLLYDGVSFDSP